MIQTYNFLYSLIYEIISWQFIVHEGKLLKAQMILSG